MNATRHALILAAMTERALEGDLTPQVVADAVEDALRDVPPTPYVAVMRLAYAPERGEIHRLTELAQRIQADAGAVAMLVMSDDADWTMLDDRALLEAGLMRVEKTHRVPREGEHLTSCCGRSMFELPRDERATADDALVTCRDGNYCTRHAQPRWRCLADTDLTGSCLIGEWP